MADTINSVTGALASPTRLPTSRNQHGEEDGFLEILVADWTRLSNFSDDYPTRQHLLITAWGILLRSYILDDLVTFQVLRQEDSSICSAKSPDLDREDQIATCKWGGLAEIQSGTMDEHKPSIRTYWTSQLPSFETLINTGISASKSRLMIPQHLDFLLEGNCEDPLGVVRLWIRQLTVPERFGQGIKATLEYILNALTKDDGLMLCEPILSASDLALMKEFTKSPLSEYQDCLHQLVSKSVTANPASEAVCSWDGNLSYDELDRSSNMIAQSLVANGVKVGQFVPFAFEKSMWSVVAVVAILKSGAAFVPIDPTQPVARLRGILADVGAEVILTSESLRQLYEPFIQTVLVVSANTTKPDTFPSLGISSLLPKVEPFHPAFVLFTSGSTGKPKGMVMQHGAYSTHTICHGKAMGYEKARVLQFAAHTFDVYVMDVFATLVFGGCVCIPSEDDRRFNIVKVFNDFRIDLAILTPSFAHVLDPALLNSLRTLAVGGEALKKETVQKWTTTSKGVSLMQIYGPAEVGICILGQLPHSNSSPETIGYPLDNSLCILVDPDDTDRLVPVGAVGELVVAGPTMLREYLNNPEKTKASFLDNPKWAKQLNLSSRRFYRSGDLLRYNIDRMDGSFDFVGRRDSQVKYHGQRMELEDIEHHLSSIKGVTACMVSLPKEGILHGRLVAVVQLESCDQARVKHDVQIKLLSNPELTLGKMREHLSQQLPGHMLPNALLVVQNVPFTPSLKLDRPRINRWVTTLDSDLVADGLVRKLCCDVLAPEELTAHTVSQEYARLVGGSDARHRAAFEGQNFSLQAGGIDSIQIISLSNFIQKVWKVKIPMSLILSSWATIRDVAAAIDRDDDRSSLSRTTQVPCAGLEANLLTKKLLAGLAGVQPTHAKSVIKNVLLTGATGFLGIEILHHLLEQGFTVYALVRSNNLASARRRLIQKARAEGWWQEIFESRLDVWLGNLSQTDLGLDDVNRWQILGKCAPSFAVHAIIHNGAKVHYALDYSSLKDINVSSTLELLRLTAESSPTIQSFVYVSGGQQLSFGDQQEIDDSADVPVEFGYTRSKLVSEAVVAKCMQQNEFQHTKLRIVKPGYIIGPARDGFSNLTDFLWRLIATCVEVGGYDADSADRWLFVADKSRVASVVVRTALQTSSPSTTKVLDGVRFTEVWQMLTDEFCIPLVSLPYSEWIVRVRDVVNAKKDAHAMFPLMHTLEEGEPIGSLSGPSTASPGVKDAIRANLRYLQAIGYLPVSINHPTKGNMTPDSYLDNVDKVDLLVSC